MESVSAYEAKTHLPGLLERVMKDLLTLARVHNLSSYDASYLDLAMRKGLPIATLDKRLIEAATTVDIKILRI